jgi:hypothetical protein
MKVYYIISISLLFLCTNVYAQQCPPSGLRIQTPLCDTPKNLRITPLSCTAVKLNWQGNGEQQYIVEVAGTDAAGNLLFEEKSAKYTCDGGNCTATIDVQEGARVNWSVQTICTISGALIYSPQIIGKEQIVPNCQLLTKEIKDKPNELIKVQPNPSAGQITVAYLSTTTAPATIKVYDGTGKVVFTTSVQTMKGNNTYHLNLSTIAAGIYNLELYNGVMSSRVSLVIQR